MFGPEDLNFLKCIEIKIVYSHSVHQIIGGTEYCFLSTYVEVCQWYGLCSRTSLELLDFYLPQVSNKLLCLCNVPRWKYRERKKEKDESSLLEKEFKKPTIEMLNYQKKKNERTITYILKEKEKKKQ